MQKNEQFGRFLFLFTAQRCGHGMHPLLKMRTGRNVS